MARGASTSVEHMNIIKAATLTAFDNMAVGTRVIARYWFMVHVKEACEEHDFETEPQALLNLPDAAGILVHGGVGKRVAALDAYVIREHRGRADIFLRRDYKSPVSSVSVVVYSRAAYLADPDVLKDPTETRRVEISAADLVLVAVIARCGDKAPLSPYRFVANLGGGNNAYLTKTGDELRAEAAEVIAADAEWCVVAD